MMDDNAIIAVVKAVQSNYRTSTDWTERAKAEVESSGNNEAIKLFSWAVL